MREKLLKLMETEHLTASRLAELLGIRSSGISHILSERNKPSFELICKIVTRFPHINPYWLLGDASDMLNPNAQNSTSNILDETPASLFDVPGEKEVVHQEIKPSALPIAPTFSNSEIEKIVIVYRDKTFEELKPKNS